MTDHLSLVAKLTIPRALLPPSFTSQWRGGGICLHFQYSSHTLKMETVDSSETLAVLYQTKRRKIPQDRNLWSHGR